MDKKTIMEKLARDSFERGSFTGAWLYAEKGVIVSRGAVGFRDENDTLPIEENTVFQLASISKQFTAAAVMLLIREGKLRLEDEITGFFPEIPYPGVTVRHLLTHTGGVPDYFDDEEWFVRIWKEEKRVPGNAEILRFLKETELKPLFAPGERFEYSNTGYNLLALLVERLSGVPYEEFLQKNLFEPAGMTSTRCCHIRRDGIPFENFAQAMVLENGRYVRDVDSEEDGVVTAFDGLNGDDYVFTDIFDLLRWDRALREGSVLTKEEQKLMYTPVVLNDGETYQDDDGEGYGFGWSVCRDPESGLVVSHSGGMPGIHTWFERFVDEDRVLVILSCREEEDVRAHYGVFRGMRAAAREKEPDPIRTIEEIALPDPDRSEWESFCGKYECPEEEEFVIEEVFMKEGDLWAKAIDDEDDEIEFRLYPIGENEFGRKGGMLRLVFEEGSVKYIGHTCRKV